MPTTPPRRKPNPANPVLRPPPADARQHPIKGLTYLVRDRDWAAVHGERLTWDEANALRKKVINQRKSTTARVEAEDVPIHPKHKKAADAARAELYADEQTNPAPMISDIKPHRVDQQLKAIHGKVLGAVSDVASAAQQRADEAAKRRAEYKRQQEEAAAETERLAADADELEGGDDTPETDIDDIINGGGAMPTDDEIKKAKSAP